MEQNYVTVNVGITSDRVKTEECQNATVSLFGCRVAPNLDRRFVIASANCEFACHCAINNSTCVHDRNGEAVGQNFQTMIEHILQMLCAKGMCVYENMI